MDGQRFDAIARGLASGVSRRSLLSGVAAGIGAAVTGWFGRDGVEAARRCRKAGEICRKPGDCCSDFCGPKDSTGRQRCDVCSDGASTCGDVGCCPSGSTCVDGECCANACGDSCCGAGESCVDGGCCPTENVCNGQFCCAETSICTVDVCCASDDVCSAGGKTFCCGAGNACDANGCVAQCELGSCASTGDCGPDQACCGGCCVEIDSDDRNCGGCGVDCGISQIDPDGRRNACCNGSCSTIPVCIE